MQFVKTELSAQFKRLNVFCFYAYVILQTHTEGSPHATVLALLGLHLVVINAERNP